MKTKIVTNNNLYPQSISMQSPSPLERVGERKSISIQSPSPLERVGERIIITLFLITSLFVNAQSWQWGKRGGSTDQLDTTGSTRQEEVFGIVTDSNKNIYTISYVGKNNLNVDGNPKTNFGDDTTLTDVCLSSFSCDGTYRWSKIFGGGGYDFMRSIQIDAQDNIYVVGWFGTCEYNSAYPPRIDNDFILPQTPSENCSLTYIAKFSSSGNLLWIKRPQDSTASQQGALIGMSTDSAGNSYVLAMLQPGTYANGVFTATVSGTYPLYLLKYDTNGNFISGSYLDIQVTGGFSDIKFSRNPYNGYYYLTSSKSDTSDTAIVGGQTIANTAFLACFNDLGQFQWVRQNSYASPGGLTFYNLSFDAQNNIYIGGRYLGFGLDTFIGFNDPVPGIPGFLMKVNPTADTLLWSTYNNKGTSNYGAIILNGNEVAYTSYCFDPDFAWGNQTLVATAAQGQATEVLLARFNKDTGACIGLSKIPGDVGYDDRGTALAVDANGDYILGGGVGHQLTFTTNSIINTGSQSDFFVAKYSTSVCSLSTKDFKEQGFELAPNPIESTVKIETQENLTYALYDITGKAIKQGTITQQENTIDFAQLTTGTYILETTNQEGAVKKVKLLKK